MLPLAENKKTKQNFISLAYLIIRLIQTILTNYFKKKKLFKLDYLNKKILRHNACNHFLSKIKLMEANTNYAFKKIDNFLSSA